jgi:hypothetical protein
VKPNCSEPWQQGADGAGAGKEAGSEKQPRTGSRWQSRETGERPIQRSGRSETISRGASRKRSPCDGRHPGLRVSWSLHGDYGRCSLGGPRRNPRKRGPRGPFGGEPGEATGMSEARHCEPSRGRERPERRCPKTADESAKPAEADCRCVKHRVLRSRSGAQAPMTSAEAHEVRVLVVE